MNDNIKKWIPKPCHLKWDDLNDDEQMAEGHIARNCDECEHHVHDLTGMSAEQIIKLQNETAAKGEKLCGMLREAPSSEKLTDAQHLRKLRRVSLASIATIAPIALASCTNTAPNQSDQPILPTQPSTPTAKPFPIDHKPERDLEKYPRFPPGMVGLVAKPKQ